MKPERRRRVAFLLPISWLRALDAELAAERARRPYVRRTRADIIRGAIYELIRGRLAPPSPGR